jgi:hypothetical protein
MCANRVEKAGLASDHATAEEVYRNLSGGNFVKPSNAITTREEEGCTSVAVFSRSS